MDHSLIKNQLIQSINFLKAPEGYIRAGHPGYFTLFGRDSLIIAWQLLNHDPTIARDTLHVLSTFQGQTFNAEHEEEPGKILHEWWGDIATKTPEKHPEIPWPFPYYGSIDSTFWFLLVASWYFKKTNDTGTLLKLKDNILAAIGWVRLQANADKDIFVDYRRKNERGIFYQSWRDVPMKPTDPWVPPLEFVEVQGYKYAAFTAISDVLEIYGQIGLALALQQEAQQLRQQFLDKYWWPEEKYYYFIFDKNDQPAKRVTSNSGHLLFTGILPADKTTSVSERLFKDDLWTPYGIRTESINSPDFDPAAYQYGSIWPHDNWIIAEGMRMNGHEEGYQKIREALLKAYEHFDGLPELYALDSHNRFIAPRQSNKLQGWAAAGLLNMIEKMV